MKRLLIASTLMVAISGVASADDRWEERREYEKERAEAIREYHEDRREAEREYMKDRREAAREYEEAAREYEKERREAYRERMKAERKWARGQHIPREYLRDRYYIRDYDRYDLAPPPNGYAYVRPYPRDDRYYLVQIATGLISRILGH